MLNPDFRAASIGTYEQNTFIPRGYTAYPLVHILRSQKDPIGGTSSAVQCPAVPPREVATCRRAVSEAVSPFGVWYHYTAVLSDRKVVYSWFLLFLPTSTTSSSAICRTAELQLQITSNRSVNVYVSLLIVLAGGLAMKVTSGANQSSF